MGPASPPELRKHAFAAGSMGPKVEAACRYVEATGGRAAIGALEDVAGLIDGSAGTQVVDGPDARQRWSRPEVRAARATAAPAAKV